jgi:hypothetical protein
VIGKVDQLAERFGVVKKDALEAAANFGLMGMASGQTKEQAAALGTEFVQMGLDIASSTTSRTRRRSRSSARAWPARSSRCGRSASS